MSKTIPTVTSEKFEQKSVKHIYSDNEKLALGGDLARSFASLRGIEAEQEAAKSGFKSRLTAVEATIDSISTSLTNGFEMRVKKCRVVFRPKDRKKDYFLEEAKNGDPAVAIEDMTEQDFQAELIQAESKFECRQELPLFAPTGQDFGTLAIGRQDERWFTALRVRIGQKVINERLDGEQPACKKRPDAVSQAVKRFNAWAKENLKELAKGFQDSTQKLIEAHKDLAE